MFCTQCGTSNQSDAKFCASCGAQLASSTQPTTSPSSIVPTPLRFAGFWLRAIALIIDTIFCEIAAILLVLPLAFALGASMAGTFSQPDIEATARALGFTCGVLVQWLWFTLAESSQWQATVGKKIMGLKVTDEKGERISFGKANVRYWSKILSALILFAGYVMAAFTEKKQALHDKIAGALVVKAGG